MDWLEGIGILAENHLKLNSYSDISDIKDELRKLNDATREANTNKKTNSSDECFEELTYILRKMAEAQGIKLDTREELKQKKEEEERIKRAKEKKEIERLVAERRAKREKEQINNCPNYSELYDLDEENSHKGFVGILIGLAVVVGFIYFLGLSISTIKNDIEYKWAKNVEPTEEIIIPTDSSVHKIESNKSVAQINKKIKTKNNNKSTKDVTLNDGSTEEIVVEEKAEIISTDKIYDVVEEMPQFPGGSCALFEYLSKNIKYPVIAEENGVQGRVVVTFVVECDGSISNVNVVKSVDPSLDCEARRVVSSMPHWIPGKQNYSAVRTKYTVPVTFRLS